MSINLNIAVDIIRVRHLILDRISPNLSKAYLNHLNLYDIGKFRIPS